MTTSNIRSRLAHTRLLLAALACMLGLLACTMGGHVGSGSVLQQDWDKRRGPVVPHDTFPQDCALCHEGGSWNRIRADFVFDHEKETGTPLRGAHAAAECLRCHNDRGPVQVFSQQGCVGCHDDVHRGKQGTNCSTCHNESNWSVNDAIALHSKTRFPLFGVHASVECWRCHAGAQVGNFDRAPIECVSCHQEQLATAVNPDHAANGWTKDCQHCHQPISWAQGDFNHSWYPLIGKHRTPPRVCTDCHVNNNYVGTPKLCVDCHLANYQATTTPAHSAANFAQTCQDCHTPNDWAPSSYQHIASFPLRYGHAVPPRACADCHGGGVFQGTGNQCVDCHLANYNATTMPNHVAANYPTSCSNCHDTINFNDAVFNHDSFPLLGTHQQVNCTGCHTSGDYTVPLPTLCYGCHQTDYDGVANPAHLAGNFPHECQDCHSNVHFTPSTFSHVATFPLTNGHAQPPRTCTDCHSGSYPYTGTPNTCVGCHGAAASVNPVYNPASNTMHIQMGANPLVCTQCHNTTVWTPALFSHTTGQTGWAYYTGMHLPPNQNTCTPCHTGSNYSNAPTACDSCHHADYVATTAPPHAASSFPTTCQTCHTTAGWTGATFNHSWWPLLGAHAVPPNQCTNCHINGVYQGTPTTCISCHANTAPNTPGAPPYPDNPPSHVNFPTTCQNCHSTVDWHGATFDHSAWWPLIGNHAVPPRVCIDCHTSGTYGPMPTTCISCHTGANFGAPGLAGSPTYGDNPPSHTGFPTTCEVCHTPASTFQSATFTHNNVGFNLTGAHITTACALCHVNNNYSGTLPTTCSGCHGTGATINPVYSTTNAPPHSPSPTVFTQTCQTCHTTAAWTGATFPHNNVGFALTGAHVSPPLACTACHTGTGAQWPIANHTCDNCHHADYLATTNPNHNAIGLPLLCSNCHSTAPNWTPVTMNHTGITQACSSCHTPDYNATTNPDHEVQGYPMTCTGSGTFTCHTSTTSWTPNSFVPATTHDNTFHLPHHSSRCNQCHTTVQVFTAFSCISGGCHPQSQTNGNHNGVSGYQYNSNACYNCHGNNLWNGPGGSGQTGTGILQVHRVLPSRRMQPQPLPVPAVPAPTPTPIPHRP